MKAKRILWVKSYASPFGPLLLGAVDDTLCLCDWRVVESLRSQRLDARLQRLLAADYREGTCEVIEAALVQLEEYFSGARTSFDLPLQWVGTEFQRKVWRELVRIPYGDCIAYAELARRLGQPKAVRAVANAVGANPLSVCVPCHRVIGSNRTLTGYAGGLDIKRRLLELERPATGLLMFP